MDNVNNVVNSDNVVNVPNADIPPKRKKGRPKKIVTDNKPGTDTDTAVKFTMVNVPIDSNNYNMLKIISFIKDINIKDIINDLINSYVVHNLAIVHDVHNLKNKHNSNNVIKVDNVHNVDKQINQVISDNGNDMPF